MPVSEVILPRTSDAMTEALLSTWLVDSGAQVSEGDLLAEVETDKAMVEVAAESDGLVVHAVSAGVAVEVGAVLAYMVTGTEVDAYREGTLELPGQVASGTTPIPTQELPKADAPDETPDPPDAPEARTTAGVRPMVSSPLARKMAREAGLNLEDLAPGSGPGGRIVRSDVESVQRTSRASTTEKPSGRQAAMAAAMVESVTTIPHFSVTRDIGIGALTDFRDQLKNSGFLAPTFSTLFVMGLALALARCPWARRTWSDGEILFHETSAIGLAVADGESDLVVPIVHGAEDKSLGQLSTQLGNLISRAKDRRLTPDELVGGIGSISNLGMFGIDSLSPIIPPGQAFIIGLGRVRELQEPSSRGARRIVVTATLSGDHRVLTGVGAAKLLEAFADVCANPVSLVAELRDGS